MHILFITKIYVLAGEWPRQADEFFATLPLIRDWCDASDKPKAAAQARWLVRHITTRAELPDQRIADAIQAVMQGLQEVLVKHRQLLRQ